jgi:hypothetical protein
LFSYSVDKSCDCFCEGKNIEQILDLLDEGGVQNMKYEVTFKKWQPVGPDGKLQKSRPMTVTADYGKVSAKVICEKGDNKSPFAKATHLPGSPNGVITLYKSACNEKVAGPLKATLLHELTHLAITEGGDQQGRPVGASPVSPMNATEYASRQMEVSGADGLNSKNIPQGDVSVKIN